MTKRSDFIRKSIIGVTGAVAGGLGFKNKSTGELPARYLIFERVKIK